MIIILSRDKLQNHYFVLRHGKSDANELEIILSNPEEGIKSYGLTKEGKEQVKMSVQEAKLRGVLDESTIIYSSDFKRCRETSEIAREILGGTGTYFTTALRERYFGTWDRTHHSNYQMIWDLDVKNPDHRVNEVESTTDVLKRTLTLIRELEKKYQNANILLVSHGDVLQILQTAFTHLSTAYHRQMPLLATAEIRKL